MDTSSSSNYRPDSHIAQQSRRDKLRILNHHDFPHNFEHFSDLAHVRNTNVLYEEDDHGVPTALVSTQVLNSYSLSGGNVFRASIGQDQQQEQETIMSNQLASNWRGVDSQQPSNYDWMINYASAGEYSNNTLHNHKPIFVGQVSSNNIARESNVSGGDVGPVQSTLMANVSNYNTPTQDGHDVVTVASLGGNPHFPPSATLDNLSFHQWNNELGVVAKRGNRQELSLSLSSNSPPKGNAAHFDESRLAGSSYISTMPKPAIISKSCGKSIHEIVGTATSNVHRTTGPLGPFTGYATILQSSRFLKPAQELLDEFCNATCSKFAATPSGEAAGEVSVSVSGDAMDNAGDGMMSRGKEKNDSSCALSSTFGPNKPFCGGGISSSYSEPYKPEFQQKKAKLTCLHDEVCRRFKQYQQQMQMVASSFESVAGLSTATPYVSLAVNTLTRNFRCLKHAISEQLKHVTKSLGEEYLAGASSSSSKGNATTSRLRYMDQNFHNLGLPRSGFVEPQQPVWRPQRGLPESSVAILRAWLFEHFLHPYPTDTDKNMLAAQTGLSRNQVSNWFINARVRVWKPMVEEIHMLETKAVAEDNQSSRRNKSIVETSPNVTSNDQLDTELQRVSTGVDLSAEQVNLEEWSIQDKRPRVEFRVPTSVEDSLVNLLPYHRSGVGDNVVGGLGAVSLTLGLRHGVLDTAQLHRHQPQQQFQEHESQITTRFRGHTIHDFSG